MNATALNEAKSELIEVGYQLCGFVEAILGMTDITEAVRTRGDELVAAHKRACERRVEALVDVLMEVKQ